MHAATEHGAGRDNRPLFPVTGLSYTQSINIHSLSIGVVQSRACSVAPLGLAHLQRKASERSWKGVFDG